MKEWFGCVAWIAFSTAVLVGSSDLQIMTRFGPGPGFFLRVLGFVLLAIALVQAVTLFIGHRRVAAHPAGPSPDNLAAILDTDENEETIEADKAGTIRFFLLAASLFGYALLLEPLGFMVATTLLAWSAMVLLGRRPGRSLVDAVVAIVVAHLLFSSLLGVNLPDASLAPLAALHL
jgi:putative tricarboxylic transport membrane protein